MAYERSALATPANAITLLRVLAAPFVIGLIISAPEKGSWLAWALWTVIAATDLADGYIARRMGTTSSGAFLDPLADKLAVLGALVALVVHGRFWWVPVALIASREIAMSVYRSVVARDGVSIPARRTAKWKTMAQSVVVAGVVFPPTAQHHQLVNIVLWASVVLTLFTGAQYLLDARKITLAKVADSTHAV